MREVIVAGHDLILRTYVLNSLRGEKLLQLRRFVGIGG